MPDHTHLLISMNPDISVSKLTGEIKSGSSKFLKDNGFVKTFDWQDGFGAFSYSKSQAPNVVNYILNQPEHHKKKTFRDEYIQLLIFLELNMMKNICLNFMIKKNIFLCIQLLLTWRSYGAINRRSYLPANYCY